MSFIRFPEKFLFGASISNYQHFGGLICDLPRIDSVKHAIYYEKDFEILKDLGLNAFRTGVDWARIEPEEGKIDQKAIKFYHDYLSKLKKTGVTTIIDLYHIGNPRWIYKYGGWASKEIVEKFLQYVELAISEYDQYIDYYQVLNEPTVAAYFSSQYKSEESLHTEEKESSRFISCLNNMNEAIRRSYDLIHEKNDEAMVGVSNPIVPFATLSENKEESGEEQENFLEKVTEWTYKEIEAHKGKFDYIGINYYGMYVADSHQFATMIVYPEGLREACKILTEKYNKPILITENGLPNRNDEEKTAFLVLHLKNLYDAITIDDSNVIGYCWWSFLPGWERFYGTGWRPFFALVDVDLVGDYERRPTQTALEYKEIIRNRGFSMRLYERCLAKRNSIRYENWL